MLSAAGLILSLAGCWLVAYRRLRRYLHLFQQDDYDGPRLLSWIVATRSFDWKLSGALLLLGLGWLAAEETVPPGLWLAAMAICFLAAAAREPNPLIEAKKPLVLTKRARALLHVSFALIVGSGLIILATSMQPTSSFLAPRAISWTLYYLATMQLMPLSLLAANGLLRPWEMRAQQRFWNEAKERLRDVQPEVIGVTGSFGKTSVKHLLGHVLALNARGFITPGSVNTPMGIARVIREALPDGCTHFVVEMGAYGLGSISKLCELTPPSIGVITAIGEAHYERFRTLDTVTRAKFELAEATLRKDRGLIVVHESVLEQPYARQFVSANRSRVIVCGSKKDADVRIQSCEQRPDGLSIVLETQAGMHRLNVPVFGDHQAGNIAIVFGVSLALALPAQRVAVALRSAPQVAHRLEVSQLEDGSIFVDDAYNSNPEGFRSALALVDRLSDGQRRRVLLTPGLVELGERHDAIHLELGRLASRHVDVAIVVRSDRIPTFVAGLRENATCEVVTLGSLRDAQAWLRLHQTCNDVVLVENDLPDLYERGLTLRAPWT